MGFSRQEHWSGLPFPSPVDHILSDLSTMTPQSCVATRARHSFIELDKAVVLVWLDWLVFCEYGFSVFALWHPLATPTIFLGFLLPWAWGISSWLLQQSAAIAPYLGRGVSPQRHPSWPSTWHSSSRPSCACAAIQVLFPKSNSLCCLLGSVQHLRNQVLIVAPTPIPPGPGRRTSSPLSSWCPVGSMTQPRFTSGEFSTISL